MNVRNALLYFAFTLTMLVTSCNNVAYAAEVDESTLNIPLMETSAVETPFLGIPATIVVNRRSCVCAVYDVYNNLVRLMVCSTGRVGHETPLGVYQIYQHTTGVGYHLMVDGTYGRYCMRWKKGGYMFHSVCYAKPGDTEPILQEVFDLGAAVSRGCVRLSVTDAEWLYDNCLDGTTVIIVDA
ncbi:L,D-transpeptidase [Candidatus Saccharibacteria bacterium]|nr:L,D-transpeptidase [Candidatus Saccharibacteria bacterium]